MGVHHETARKKSESSRLYAEARGIQSVLVNGTLLIEDNRFTGWLPGALLRRGRDTVTLLPNAG
jgi:hypothetical protein